MVDMVATTPIRLVALPIMAASGNGSCLGACSAHFSVPSAVRFHASDTISVSSSMM